MKFNLKTIRVLHRYVEKRPSPMLRIEDLRQGAMLQIRLLGLFSDELSRRREPSPQTEPATLPQIN